MDPKVVRANHWKKMKMLSQSFYDAALNGDVTLFKQLKENGAQFCKIGKIKMNPLHAASMNGHYDIVTILVETGIDINECTKEGKSALQIAVINGHAKIVILLLTFGALLDSRDKMGMTPLLCAYKNNNTTIVNIILKYMEYTMNKGDPKDIQSELEKCIEPAVSYNAEYLTKNSFISYQEYVASHAEEDRITKEKQNDILQQLNELENEDIAIEPFLLDEEETETLADLMKIQATIMTKEDASLMLIRLMGHGRTMELTEAGRRAFEMVKPDWLFKSKQKNEDDEVKRTTDRLHLGEKQPTSSALVLHRNHNRSPSPTNYLQELSQTLNTFSPTFNYNPRLGSSPPMKRCRV